MRGKWHILLVLAALGCGALAAICHQQTLRIGSQADAAEERSIRSSSSFVDTFSGQFVDSQLGQLDQRRQLIQSAAHWREGMLFSLVGFVFFAFAGYALRTVETAFDAAAANDRLPFPQRP